MNQFRRPLRRSRDDRMVAGVVSGIAEYLEVDATLARVVFVILSLVSAAFPGLLVYLLLWLVIPEQER